MKKGLFFLLGVILACSFAMTALAACGDDDDSAGNGNGEVCVVAVLPNTIAPNANLEVTYYDAQGTAKHFTVRNGESSDDLLGYSKEALQLLQLFGGFTIDYSKCILRTVRFSAPSGTKIACKYKMVLNGVEISGFPSKVFAPFAVVTGKRPTGETLAVQGLAMFSQMTISSLDSYKVWLEQNNGIERENYVTVE